VDAVEEGSWGRKYANFFWMSYSNRLRQIDLHRGYLHADDHPARILDGDLHRFTRHRHRESRCGRGIGVTARGSRMTSEVRDKIRLLYEVDNWRQMVVFPASKNAQVVKLGPETKL